MTRAAPSQGAPYDRAAAGELTRGFVLAGRYEVQALLGRGGMGVVVRAFDRVIGEDVAIKVLRPEYAQDRRWTDRLAREVKLARTIQHPNVCRIFDFGEADGHSYITMELASGGTLRDAIAGAADRPVEDRVADATAVIHGLAAIHAAGIVHRDVTPQNILRMGDGRLVVSDFGLASIATGTTTSIHGGTIAYMAPEVLQGAGAANFASDVWGLGIIVWEVLTGVRPAVGSEDLPAFFRRDQVVKSSAVSCASVTRASSRTHNGALGQRGMCWRCWSNAAVCLERCGGAQSHGWWPGPQRFSLQLSV